MIALLTVEFGSYYYGFQGAKAAREVRPRLATYEVRDGE